MFATVDDVILRETALIEQKHPKWHDLSGHWFTG